MHKYPDKILSTQLPASPHLSAAALLANVSGVLVNIYNKEWKKYYIKA